MSREQNNIGVTMWEKAAEMTMETAQRKTPGNGSFIASAEGSSRLGAWPLMQPRMTTFARREAETAQQQEAPEYNHYFREVDGLTHIDVYRVLEMFGVTDPCLQHIVKKALCAGQRGSKDFETDVNEILATAKRRVQMLKEDAAR